MASSRLERRLADLSARLRDLRAELLLADEQLAHLAGEADEARIRSLVSETPLASREHLEAERHAEAMRRHRAGVAAEIEALERELDATLDRFSAARADRGRPG